MTLSTEIPDCLLTVPEAAQLLKLSVGTVYHLISEKRVPVIKMSPRCVRFSRQALLVWLDDLTQPVADFSDANQRRERLRVSKDR
jgi:excisionase family DNA binding protein